MSDIIPLYTQTEGSGDRVFGATGWTVPSPDDFTQALPKGLSNRAITTFHYRGTGQSPTPSSGEHSIEAYSRDLIALIDAQGVDHPHLIGIGGMGAIVAMQTACKIPDRVRSLVLHQGWARCDTMLKWQIQSMRNLLADSGFEQYRLLAAALCYTPDYMQTNEKDIMEIGWAKMRNHKDQHLAFMDASLAFDIRDQLHKISCPTLIITGDATDYITGDRLVGEIKAGIPHAEVHIMKGVPHSFKQQASWIDEFDSVVGSFWDRN